MSLINPIIKDVYYVLNNYLEPKDFLSLFESCHILKDWLSKFWLKKKVQYYKYDVKVAIDKRQIDVVSWLKNMGYNNFTQMSRIKINTIHILNWITEKNRPDIIKWLYENDIIYPKYTALQRIVSMGCLDTVKWFFETYKNVYKNINKIQQSYIMNIAANYGHLDIVKWLHKNRSEGCTYVAIDSAITNEHFEIAKFLHKNRNDDFTVTAIDYCAKHNYLGTIKSIYANNINLDNIENMKHLKIIKWLLKYGGKGFTTISIENAATNGHIDTFKWLLSKNKNFCFYRAINLATKNDHKDIVIWFYDHFKNIPSERISFETVILNSMRFGTIDIVKELIF